MVMVGMHLTDTMFMVTDMVSPQATMVMERTTETVAATINPAQLTMVILPDTDNQRTVMATGTAAMVMAAAYAFQLPILEFELAISCS